MSKVYSGPSKAVNQEQGLFAATKICKGDVIAEFTGHLLTPEEDYTQTRSNIKFADGYTLSCDEDDLASFANDIIDFPIKPRKIITCLNSNMPFYTKKSDFKLNATIKIDNEFHRAHLEAVTDIEPDEEILCHYGFTQWFYKEITQNGFLYDPEYDTKSFPKNIYNLPGFVEYIREFYPEAEEIQITDKNVIIIKNDECIVFDKIDYSNMFTEVEFKPAQKIPFTKN